MDEELAPANQRIDEMSFKDLTIRAAAAMKPTPTEPVKPAAKDDETKVVVVDAPVEPKTS